MDRVAEIDTSTEDGGGPKGLSRMIEKDYCPPEVVVEMAKCLLGMLHYRVLSWAQF
jgi:hypothetical protein